MYTRARTVGTLAALVIVAGNSGCFLDQYRQEQMANRQLRAHKESLENELLEARTSVDSLNSRLGAKDAELSALGQTLASLRDQAGVYDEARRQAQSALEEMLKRGPGDPIVITTRLPAELDRALKAFAAQHPDKVEYIPEQGAVRWKSDLLFALGSDVVRDSAKPSLEDFGRIVQSPEAMGFEPLIVGHTDNKPIKRAQTRQQHKSNWHLSVHRAISVMDVLHGFGVNETRMVVAGCGEWRPVVDNIGGAAAQSRNRRVEIFLVSRDRQPGSTPTAKADTSEAAAGK